MKYSLKFLFLLFSPVIFADNFLKTVKEVNQKIGEQQIDKHINSKGQFPIAGEHLEAIIPTKIGGKDPKDCPPHVSSPLPLPPPPPPAQNYKTRYEVIFIGEARSQQGILTPISESAAQLHRAFVNSMLSYAANSNLSQTQLAGALATMIKSKYASREERFNVLSSIAGRFNENYNFARNPGANNDTSNPNKVPLPTASLTLQQISKAALNSDPFNGGVCNDIVAAVAMIAEQIFPEDDVLAINSGSHLGLLISDGKTNRVINYDKQLSMQNRLSLDEKYSATNMRIAKMDNGHLKQIAIVDTQTGQLMEQAFRTGKPLLKTNTDINSIISIFKILIEGSENKHEVSLGAGGADLKQSKMYVVVAKYEYNSNRWRNYVGVGGSQMSSNTSPEELYKLHVRTGSELTLIRYATPKLSLDIASGVQTEFQYGANPKTDISSFIDVAGNLDVVNRLRLAYRPTTNLKLATQMETRHTFGPASWGDAVGAWANGTGSGIVGTLSNMHFHLNQINISASAEYKISKNIKALAEVKYQGSNIGQSLGIMTGVNITAPEGVEILIFTGHNTTKIPGFDTKHSLLVGPNGLAIGAGIQTPSGISVTGAVRNISSDFPPTVEGMITIPFSAPPPKKNDHGNLPLNQ